MLLEWKPCWIRVKQGKLLKDELFREFVKGFGDKSDMVLVINNNLVIAKRIQVLLLGDVVPE
jgi:hypothetical protein